MRSPVSIRKYVQYSSVQFSFLDCCTVQQQHYTGTNMVEVVIKGRAKDWISKRDTILSRKKNVAFFYKSTELSSHFSTIYHLHFFISCCNVKLCLRDQQFE